MSNSSRFDPRTSVLVLMIVAIGAIRIIFNFNHDITPIANFSPLGAMALFGGAYFDKRWKGFLFPLLTLFLSDFILHQTVFKSYGNGILYGGWYWVYGAFVLMTMAGWLLKKISVPAFIGSVVVCTLIHWLVTDLGVWMGSKIYAQNLGGYIDCLIVAIPYELRFLIGTLVYGTILFGAFEWITARYRRLA